MKKIIRAVGCALTAVALSAGTAHADPEVNRVIDSRGTVVCLILQTGDLGDPRIIGDERGLSQKTLDEAAKYIMTTPAMKLSKQQGIEVLQGSVETYCPEYSEVIAEVFG